MSNSTIDYSNLTSAALRSVVASVLQQVAESGLPGEHFFYLSFRTDFEGVEMPPEVRLNHPEEITIVLQNQFWDLFADEELFAVTLRFQGVPQRLTVPFEAMTAFVDPTAEFALRFVEESATDDGAIADGEGYDEATETTGNDVAGEPPTRPREQTAGEEATVVQLDDFRQR